jgi:hypothetical protein
MLRRLAGLVVVGFALSFASVPVSAPAFGATSAQKERALAKRSVAKRYAKRHRARRAGYGRYGFLPGVRPPEIVEMENEWRAAHRPYYALPWARFHRGRWNGGGFGPCYTYTPIGPIWNCGR